MTFYFIQLYIFEKAVIDCKRKISSQHLSHQLGWAYLLGATVILGPDFFSISV